LNRNRLIPSSLEQLDHGGLEGPLSDKNKHQDYQMPGRKAKRYDLIVSKT
jgi:hypothetical protein